MTAQWTLAREADVLILCLCDLGSRPVCGNWVERVATIGVPGICIVLRIARSPLERVEYLPATNGPIAVIAKVLG